MKTAQHWFSPGEGEFGPEPKTTENIGYANSNSNAQTTPRTTSTTTPVSMSKSFDYDSNSHDDYYNDDYDDGRPYRAVVIDAVQPMAVR
jgi:hypothetical protein